MSGGVERESAGAAAPFAASGGARERRRRLGIETTEGELVVALAGNPNTGKSTVFNALTGLNQHTGNWPGKTVTRAEGSFSHAGRRWRLVDLPGTYSLLAMSLDEQVARDFLLFGEPDVTVVVLDATRLERNLHLALQVLAITPRVVVCLNLADEARRKGIALDAAALSRELGVPVVETSARYGEGLDRLRETLAVQGTASVSRGVLRLVLEPEALRPALTDLVARIERLFPGLPNTRWVALRLLDGDERILEAVRTGELGTISRYEPPVASAEAAVAPSRVEVGEDAVMVERRELLVASREWRRRTGDTHEAWAAVLYREAARIAGAVTTRREDPAARRRERAIDRLVTSRTWGFPIMLALFTGVFWLTIAGANVPSALLADLLIGEFHPRLQALAAALGLPVFVRGLLVDGVYLAGAWVISVMLPPMAIFFPCFTILEDLGYLPRVAFNLDALFRRAGAHGRQALSMMMGFGCNAAGVIACRIIDSPRERLIAILTNNFALCNGRWPTQILVATLFIGTLAPPALAGVVSASAVVGVTLLGVVLTLGVSWALSRTVLRGEVSAFSLELPPYRPPRILQTLYTSLIDRTLQVLWRAVVFAFPAGAVIWLLANIPFGSGSLAEAIIAALDPFARVFGLNGVILLAYLIAIPANEIVIPTVLMLTVLSADLSGVGAGAGVMFELDNDAETLAVLKAGGWSLLTAINLMLFSLLHNPCSTTIFTIWKETRSRRWTVVSVVLPLVLGFLTTFLVTQFWRFLGLPE